MRFDLELFNGWSLVGLVLASKMYTLVPHCTWRVDHEMVLIGGARSLVSHVVIFVLHFLKLVVRVVIALCILIHMTWNPTNG